MRCLKEAALQRRYLLTSVLLASTSLSAFAQEKPFTLIYVGGWDCGPCISWKNNQKPNWLASAQYAKVNYVEIESPKLKEAYRDQYWPERYRPIREQLPSKVGTPRFILVRDGTVIANEWGRGDWARTWEKIQQVVT
jgi:hypothetical protein